MLQAGRSSLPQRLLQAGHYSLPLRVLQAELFYFETKKIGVGRSSLLRPGQAPHDHAAGGPFYFATKKIGIGRGAVATTTAAGGLFYFAGTMALHRFLISGQDLRIAAAAGPFLGEIVQ